MSSYSRFFGPNEAEAGTAYPSGLTGKKNARGYLGPAGRWNPTPLQGLQQSALPPPTEDPLGIAVQQRGMQHAMTATTNGERAIGSLPDPQWEGFFQSLGEHGVDKVSGANMLHNSDGPQPPPGFVENAPINPLNNGYHSPGGQNIFGKLSNPARALQSLKYR